MSNHTATHRVPGWQTPLVIVSSLLMAYPAMADILTRDNGASVGDNQNSQNRRSQRSGSVAGCSVAAKLQRFDRERIPERVVHARGTGAHGEFTATEDISI